MFFRKKDKQKTENDMLLQRLDTREVQYVSRRDPVNYGETILGKNGAINIIDDELVIVCNNRIIFRMKLEKLEADELMSLNGVNLRYIDEKTGQQQALIAYYKYHRK